AHAQEWIALTIERETCNRLIAARVQGPDGHGPALCPLDDAAIGGVLRPLIGKARAAMKQEFGAYEANAVARGGIEPVELVWIGNIDVRRNAHTVARHSGLVEELCGFGIAR